MPWYDITHFWNTKFICSINIWSNYHPSSPKKLFCDSMFLYKFYTFIIMFQRPTHVRSHKLTNVRSYTRYKIDLYQIVRKYIGHNITQNNVKPYVIVLKITILCVLVRTLKYFMGLLNSTHDLMCVGFTIKYPVWDISLTNFLSILRIFSNAQCLGIISCAKSKE